MKMNRSRALYFEALTQRLMELSTEEWAFRCGALEKEIAYQIERIYRSQRNGFWGISDGDRTFICFMSRLSMLLHGEKPEQRLRELLNEARGNTAERWKIVLYCQETFVWPSLESLYHALVADGHYEPQLVYVPFRNRNESDRIDHLQIYRRDYHLPMFTHQEYNVSAQSPDIAVFIKPYDSDVPIECRYSQVRRVVPRCMYLFYGIEIPVLIQKRYHEIPVNTAWCYSVYGPLLKQAFIQNGYCNGENIRIWGHPRTDAFIGKKRTETPLEWVHKIKSRQTFLWCPHYLEHYCTFPLLVDTIIDYFVAHPELFLIVRPHPFLPRALVEQGIYHETEMGEFIRRFQTTENMVLDESSDYHLSFDASCAIITDPSSFALEYLLTGRPVLQTECVDMPVDKDFTIFDQARYHAGTPEELLSFLEMIRAGEDPLKEKRNAVVREQFFLPPQGVGVYMTEQIPRAIQAEVCMEVDYAFASLTRGGERA